MAFDYPVNLDLRDRRAVVFGGGPLAVQRVEELLRSRARVTVVTPRPDPALRRPDLTLIERTGEVVDLVGAFLAICTREDDAPVEDLWAAAERTGVLFASLDDVAHCHFGAASQVRRGDLTLTISTAGKAPALSKRLRRHLEDLVGPEYGELVEVLHDARERLLPRTVPFHPWASAWGAALEDLDALLTLVRTEGSEVAVERLVAEVGAAVRSSVRTG